MPAYNAAVALMVQSKQAAGKHVGFADMSAVTASDLVDPYHPGYQKMADDWNKAVLSAAANGSAVAGKCLDVNGGSTANGGLLQLWDCNQSNGRSGSSTAPPWSTPAPPGAWTFPAAPWPTTPRSRSGTATATPTSSGPYPAHRSGHRSGV